MSKVLDLRETITPPEEVIQAGLDGSLILFIGAGVSRLLELPSWNELALCVLKDLRNKSLLILLRHIILYISSVSIAKNNFRVEHDQ